MGTLDGRMTFDCVDQLLFCVFLTTLTAHSSRFVLSSFLSVWVFWFLSFDSRFFLSR